MHCTTPLILSTHPPFVVRHCFRPLSPIRRLLHPRCARLGSRARLAAPGPAPAPRLCTAFDLPSSSCRRVCACSSTSAQLSQCWTFCFQSRFPLCAEWTPIDPELPNRAPPPPSRERNNKPPPPRAAPRMLGERLCLARNTHCHCFPARAAYARRCILQGRAPRAVQGSLSAFQRCRDCGEFASRCNTLQCVVDGAPPSSTQCFSSALLGSPTPCIELCFACNIFLWRK
jgi:hypothetical protein